MGPFHWNVDPFIAHFGRVELRWYSLLFVIGILAGSWRLWRSFEDRGLPAAHARALAWILPVAMLFGAHFVHLLFYEPRSFLDRPWRILDLGHGLASHGGALGAVTAAVVFARMHGRKAHEYLDAAMVPSIWVFPWVRIGNFVNSEILGRPTDMPWGVVFDRVDPLHARHPVQLYEALAAFVLLALGEWVDRKYRDRLRPGALFYLLLGAYFTYRFALEFFKATQGIDDGWGLNMGHLLSLGPLALCLWMLFGSRRFRLFPLVTRQLEAEPRALEPRKK